MIEFTIRIHLQRTARADRFNQNIIDIQWAKILTGKINKLYLLLLYLHKNNIYSCKWIVFIEKILQDVGLDYIWLSNVVTNINWPCREVQNRL